MFCILLQKNETFSRSFTFFAKERNILCVLSRSLQKNVAFSAAAVSIDLPGGVISWLLARVQQVASSTSSCPAPHWYRPRFGHPAVLDLSNRTCLALYLACCQTSSLQKSAVQYCWFSNWSQFILQNNLIKNNVRKVSFLKPNNEKKNGTFEYHKGEADLWQVVADLWQEVADLWQEVADLWQKVAVLLSWQKADEFWAEEVDLSSKGTGFCGNDSRLWWVEGEALLWWCEADLWWWWADLWADWSVLWIEVWDIRCKEDVYLDESCCDLL